MRATDLSLRGGGIIQYFSKINRMVADLSSKPGRFSSKFLFYQFGVLGGVSARSHFRVVKVGASPKFNRSRVSASQIDPSIADVGDLKHTIG